MPAFRNGHVRGSRGKSGLNPLETPGKAFASSCDGFVSQACDVQVSAN
jgi:hypothetical protein